MWVCRYMNFFFKILVNYLSAISWVFLWIQTSKASSHESPSATTDGARGLGNLRGARIGIVAKPSAEFVAGILGTWLSGGVAVPLALSYPEAELLHVMNDSVSSISSLFLHFFLNALFLPQTLNWIDFFIINLFSSFFVCNMFSTVLRTLNLFIQSSPYLYD